MEIKSRKPVLRFAPAKAGFAFAGVLPLLVAAQAQAVEFSFADNEITGSIDTTISYGQLWRVQGQDKTQCHQLKEFSYKYHIISAKFSA